MFISDKWEDYELIDASDGERLERWGKYILRRPDPQIIWKNAKKSNLWNKADAVYSRKGGGGEWVKRDVPESWKISYGDLAFKIKPMGFIESSFSSGVLYGLTSQETLHSRTRRAISSLYCPPKSRTRTF